METMGLTEENVRLTTGAATAAVIRHRQVLVPKEGNEGREKTTATTAQAQHCAQRTATQKERETEEQPALAFSVDRGHPSSALFIRPFFQKYIQSP
ncbi:unnamed protein product [Sphagnum troendelagicum]|uniref:Uncharacterized protein n=1 Tax=Sphagnum jensenii TaxID=128206 RepID=A0ABP0WHD7_9BRYO